MHHMPLCPQDVGHPSPAPTAMPGAVHQNKRRFACHGAIIRKNWRNTAMIQATDHIEKTAYRTTVQTGRHTLTCDEPADRGGQGVGPTPSELLVSALASCTAITLRMYADHKQWPLEAVRVDVTMQRAADKSTSMDRVLKFEGNLTDEQRARLADIAERTPVTLTLKGGSEIRTTVA